MASAAPARCATAPHFLPRAAALPLSRVAGRCGLVAAQRGEDAVLCAQRPCSLPPTSPPQAGFEKERQTVADLGSFLSQGQLHLIYVLGWTVEC